MATDVELDATVLRETALGDVEIRHHLDPGRDRKREMLRRRHHLLKHPLRLEPDAKLALERLEVDVASAVADRQEEHHVEELANRGALGEGLDARQIGGPFAAEAGRLRRQLLVVFQALDDRFDALVVGRIKLLDRLLDLLLRGHDVVDVEAEKRAELVGDLDLLRLRRRHREPVAGKLDRNHPVELGHRLTDELEHLRGNRPVVERDERRIPLLGQRLAELILAEKPERQPHLPDQLAAAGLLLLEHLLELALVDEAEVDEDLSDALEGHGRGSTAGGRSGMRGGVGLGSRGAGGRGSGHMSLARRLMSSSSSNTPAFALAIRAARSSGAWAFISTASSVTFPLSQSWKRLSSRSTMPSLAPV